MGNVPRPWLRATTLRRSPLGVAMAAACCVALVAGVIIAWQRPGFAQVPPQPVDTSVWVLRNQGTAYLGRINTGIGELDSAAALRGVSQVLQDPTGRPSDEVVVLDPDKHELQVLDTATVTFGARAAIPVDAQVALRGGTVAVADRADGRLWVGSAQDLGTVDAEAASPAATLGAQAVLTVSPSGTVFATRPGAGDLVRVTPGDEPTTLPLGGGPLSLGTVGGATAAGSGDIQLTTVGETPVVLDRADSALRVDGRQIPLPELPGALLQEPGPAAGEVLLASGAGLLAVGLADGAVRTVAAADGAPVAPVVTAGCRYAAWVGRGVPAPITALAACGDDSADPVTMSGPAGAIGATGLTGLTLRARGAAVVLTDAGSGRSWIASDGFRPVDNWSDVTPDDPVDTTVTVEEPTSTDELPRLPPDCTAVPVAAPRAADDQFGVRAGRASVLRVLDNDPSVDCTTVVIDSVTPLPAELGSVAVVGNGSALQVTVSDTATALPPIQYQVSNGAGGTATAAVSITVVPAGSTEPAKPVRRSAVSAEVDGTVSYNVLDDMVSPTGDDLFLVSAATTGADVVSFRPDGTITYRNTGAGVGTDVPVEFVVSDGVEQATGTLTVSVGPAGSGVPVVYPAFGRTVVGRPAVVDLRRSVVSGSTDPLTIGAVQPEGAARTATARLDARTGTVSVTAGEPGSYYFTFEAAAGGRGTTGVLRVDVAPADDAAAAVVPMLDLAYLPADGETVIDPTANDTDPKGRGLAVQQVVEADPTGSMPVTAAVVDLHLVRIGGSRPLRAPVELAYTVFDGTDSPTGLIRVVPVPAPRVVPPPLTAPVQATVRAGDAVTIPVTRFTTSQDGAPVTVTVDAAQVAALPGRVLVTGDAIRYLAPADAPAGQVSFGYIASSGSADAGQPAQSAGTVTIAVTAADGKNRSPDAPPPVTARVFAGGAITVTAPLAGIDPDGDWVTLQSIEQPEAPLGDLRVAGPDSLSYTAFGTPGIDHLTYVAADPSGATVTGEMTVLVVAPSAAARPPVAPDLAVSVRPGTSIRVDPLASVVDPGGLPVSLADPAFTATAGLQVQVDEGGLILTAPAEPTVGTVRYTVVNAKGLTASGSVRVTVSPDAPMLDPVAQDVFVQPADLTTDPLTGAASVAVDLTGSVINRSGRGSELTVSVDPVSGAVATLDDRRTIRVAVSAVRQVIAYQVTDAYGGRAGAFIVVPPRDRLDGPQLRAGVGPIDLDAGRSVEVAIDDYVVVGGTGQDPATIATDPAPRATQGSVVRTSASTLTLTAPSDAGGSAAVYVPIAVGTGPPVVLGIPVRITPRLIPPPRLDSAELAVEAGTSAALDLQPLTTTYDERQQAGISYGVGTGSDGVQARLQGSTVTVTAAADAPRGTRIELPIGVSDGDGKQGKATLTVTVTGSTKPLPTVVDQQVGQARGGVEVSVDVLTGSLDPVGLGLTASGVRVVDGAAGVATGPTLTGSTVTLTPAAGFVGEIVVAADVLDGTRDPDRLVTATLRVQIQDRPSAPGVPAAVPGTVTARSVQLQWAPSAANGAPVQNYTVSGGGITQDCPGSDSTCVIGGLTPGQAFVFVVSATNAVGRSDPSAPSAVIVPDATPATPAAPSVEYRARGEVAVSWSVPTGDFTPVTAMSLQVLQDDQVVQVLDAATSPTVLSGLNSAAAYRFQVRAGNQQGVSDWSAASGAIIPSGVPSVPSALTAQFVYDAGRRGVQVSWAPPADDGGEAVQGYRLLVGNQVAATGGADWLSAFVPVTGNDPVTVAVVAQNPRGDSPPAGPATVAPFARPAAVTGLTVTPGDSSLAAAWSPADSPGRPIADYQFRVDGGSWTSAGPSTSATIGSLANGTEYTVQVRACNGESGFAEDVRCGPAGDPATGRPFGALADPTLVVGPPDKWGRSMAVSWTFPGGNGREVLSQSVQITGSVTDSPAVSGLTGTWQRDLDYGSTITVTARYCVAAAGGQDCRQTKASGSTATVFAVATQSLAPLPGTCAADEPYPGEWRLEADCDPAHWVPAPAPASLLCVRSGPAYPEFPTGNPAPTPFKMLNQWYLATDGKWFRQPILTNPDSKIPSCN
ncbi:MAG: fibronectin type III domain-containing protein [Nakamurella multipartita]